MSNQFHCDTFMRMELVRGLKECTKIVAFSFFIGAVEASGPVIAVGEGDLNGDHLMLPSSGREPTLSRNG